MKGWIKLMETYRQKRPSTEQTIRTYSKNTKFTKSNNLLTTSLNTNGHRLLPCEPIKSTITVNSPPNIFSSPSIISIESSPKQIMDDIPSIEIEPITPPSCTRDDRLSSIETQTTISSVSSGRKNEFVFVSHLDSYHTPTKRVKKVKNSKTTKLKKPLAKELLTPITEDISDDDIPLVDIRRQKLKSIDTLAQSIVTDSIIPLATDLQSLPGHNLDDTRDVRFLNYTDADSLAVHLQTCLYVDQNSFIPKQLSNENNRTNVLKKILKIYYYKVFRRNLALEKNLVLFNENDKQNHQPLSLISSPTSTSFKIDWLVNQRNRSSKQRNQPTNLFHILQTKPKQTLDVPTNSSTTTTTTTSNNSKTHIQSFERVKDLLARTYYPRLHTAIQCGYQFGAKSCFLSTHQLITTHDDTTSIKQMPESPYFNDDLTTIRLISPPVLPRRYSIFDQPILSPNLHVQTDLNDDGSIDDSSPVIIKESVVVLTQTRIPSPISSYFDSQTDSTNNRKRRSSPTKDTNTTERKKKRIVSSPSPEIPEPYEDISNSESETSHVPKSNSIRNGLRSHSSTTINKKSRSERRRRPSSDSIPSIYTTFLQSDDEDKIVRNSSVHSHQKKKSCQPKQKQPSPYKKITRNTYTDQIKQKLLANYSTENASACECKPSATCEDGVCLNKMSFTECLSTCVCGSKCSNQKIRKTQWCKSLEVFDTGKYGQGLRTTAPISKGTFLCEYVGEIINEDKFIERMTSLYSKDEHHYAMKLTQNFVIDAYRSGSLARFANHSCVPNCEFQKWTVDGLQRMCLFASRNIKAGEEITYDYNFQFFNVQSQQACYCETSKCRGTIGGKQQLTGTQKISPKEKRMILSSSIFLMRNLRKVKQKYRLKKRNRKQTSTNHHKQSIPDLFFPQNYYHPHINRSTLASLRKSSKINHKDLFYLFYNYIRRSHFTKTGRYQIELIDATCYYAQLAQLTLILHDIFDLILHYKTFDTDINPSMYLRTCPSKRLFPAYYQIIAKPIDLTSIKTKLDNGEYESFESFQQDIDLLFQNAIKYCGDDSNETRAIDDLQDYFNGTIKNEYENKFKLFNRMKILQENTENVQTFEQFLTDFHKKEVIEGQIREILYDIIYAVDDDTKTKAPITYKIVLANGSNSHRSHRSKSSSDTIVHCRCGSVCDENSLVQCYACQLWQHVACVTIIDPSRPYYCFECQPICEFESSRCLKSNVLISSTLSPLQIDDDNHNSFSTLTRTDGFVIRVNECYFVPKQDTKNINRALTSPEYDILCIERLWIDDDGNSQAAGFYYIRPNETFHEPTRKFFPNEVFRFPSSNDPVPIQSIVRPCFVLDIKTYTKGKPISDNSTRVLPSDIFVCEYRVDKTARTFTRFKSKHFGINTKSYCFDNYVEKLTVKRDYQVCFFDNKTKTVIIFCLKPYEKEVQQHCQHDNRLRLLLNSTKLTNRQIKDKMTRLNGCLENIYCHFHDQSEISHPTKTTFEQIFGSSQPNSPDKIRKKRRTISVSSDDDIIELLVDQDCQSPAKKRSTTKQKIISPRKRDDLYC